MSPPMLRTRILGALKLGPMTDVQLARALDRPETHVQAVRHRLLRWGLIRIDGYGSRRVKRGPIPHRYTLA